jgi:hypothetical protein
VGRHVDADTSATGKFALGRVPSRGSARTGMARRLRSSTSVGGEGVRISGHGVIDFRDASSTLLNAAHGSAVACITTTGTRTSPTHQADLTLTLWPTHTDPMAE